MPSTIISLIEQDLIRDEGWRDKPYQDTTGHLTIGVGHNLDASGLCDDAILAQLRFDLRRCEGELDRSLPWWRDHPPAVQRVFLNLWFNLGAKFLKWPLTLGHLQLKQYRNAARDIRTNSIYVKQVGRRAERLALLLESVV